MTVFELAFAKRRGAGASLSRVGGYAYHASVSAERPAWHYTPQIIHYHPVTRVPLDDARVLWFAEA